LRGHIASSPQRVQGAAGRGARGWRGHLSVEALATCLILKGTGVTRQNAYAHLGSRRIATLFRILLDTLMTERWLRRDEDFLRFQPYRKIVAPPLAEKRRADRWSVFKRLTILIIASLLVTGAVYFTQL